MRKGVILLVAAILTLSCALIPATVSPPPTATQPPPPSATNSPQPTATSSPTPTHTPTPLLPPMLESTPYPLPADALSPQTIDSVTELGR